MLARLGRFFQILGLVILPAAMAGQAMREITVWHMLAIAGLGMVVFMVGWLLQKAGSPR